MYIFIEVSLSMEDEIRPIKLVLEDLTDKEKRSLSEALKAVSIDYGPDYSNYIWDIIKILIGKEFIRNVPDEGCVELDNIIRLLDPEWGKWNLTDF
jgi:hypothetical protein